MIIVNKKRITKQHTIRFISNHVILATSSYMCLCTRIAHDMRAKEFGIGTSNNSCC